LVEAYGSQAWRVQDAAATRNPEKLPSGGGVAFLSVAFPDRRSGLMFFSKQGVDQAGLPNPRGAEYHPGDSRGKKLTKFLYADCEADTGDHKGNARGNSAHFFQDLGDIGAAVRLVQDQHGGSPGLSHQGQGPF
jgi:hypothetical protein